MSQPGYTDLSDEQWCVLDLLMRAKERGVSRLSRQEILKNAKLPQVAAMKLTWAALTMPARYVEWHGQHEFEITADGVALYNLRFGTATQPAMPTKTADHVICLPGPEHYAS